MLLLIIARHYVPRFWLDLLAFIARSSLYSSLSSRYLLIAPRFYRSSLLFIVFIAIISLYLCCFYLFIVHRSLLSLFSSSLFTILYSLYLYRSSLFYRSSLYSYFSRSSLLFIALFIFFTLSSFTYFYPYRSSLISFALLSIYYYRSSLCSSLLVR